jgi:pyrroloquinoline quinone biosynthesis protein D
MSTMSAQHSGLASLPLKPALSSVFRLQFEPAQGAWVLLYPEGMVQLNPSAAEILRRCDGTRSVDDIVAELQGEFGVQGIGPDVLALLEEGGRRGWIR